MFHRSLRARKEVSKFEESNFEPYFLPDHDKRGIAVISAGFCSEGIATVDKGNKSGEDDGIDYFTDVNGLDINNISSTSKFSKREQ